jgi:hypothetical protein
VDSLVGNAPTGERWFTSNLAAVNPEVDAPRRSKQCLASVADTRARRGTAFTNASRPDEASATGGVRMHGVDVDVATDGSSTTIVRSGRVAP